MSVQDVFSDIILHLSLFDQHKGAIMPRGVSFQNIRMTYWIKRRSDNDWTYVSGNKLSYLLAKKCGYLVAIAK